MNPVDRTSTPINDRRKQVLKEEFPEIWVEGKIDFDQLKNTLGEMVDDSPERYSFTWAGKKDALKILQTPTRATLSPVKEKSVDFADTKNLFIEGDNLEVLKLLFKSYLNQVKLIYIDPPFNTGKDFIYPDDFRAPLEPYLKLIGEMDAEGNLLTSNPDTSGRYHSSWLSMMYPRLFMARQLLREDGAIFVEIDDTEMHNLRMIMNEIFGEENFVATIIWQKKYSPQNDARWLSDNHDYIICYAKNKEIWRPNLLPRTEEANSRYTNRDNDPRGRWKSSDLLRKDVQESGLYTIVTPQGRVCDPPVGTSWRVPEYRYEELVDDNRIWFGEDGSNVPSIKRFLSEVQQGIVPLTIWTYDEVGHNQEAKQELKELMEGVETVFDTPKPIRLLSRIIHLGSNPDTNDIILDFFAGSCSTAHAVMSKNVEENGNRQYICVQLPEPIDAPDFSTVADLGMERIRRAGLKLREDIKSPNIDLGYRNYKLSESNFKTWEGLEESTLEEYFKEMDEHVETLEEEWNPEDLIYEVLLKEGYPLTAKINQINSDTNTVYKITAEEEYFYICFDEEIQKETIEQLGLEKETLLVVRDAALTDTQAANLALQCTLKTI